MTKLKLFSFLLIICLFGVFSVSADVEQMKIYKGVYGESAKCIQCHIDKIPKKDPGMHESNEYGKKVTAIEAKPTAEAYQKAGKAPAA